MTITVDITVSHGDEVFKERVAVGHEAERAVRFSFNPSGLMSVVVLKALAAALYQRADDLRNEDLSKALEAGHACYHTQTASMWAVAGATKDL